MLIVLNKPFVDVFSNKRAVTNLRNVLSYYTISLVMLIAFLNLKTCKIISYYGPQANHRPMTFVSFCEMEVTGLYRVITFEMCSKISYEAEYQLNDEGLAIYSLCFGKGGGCLK